MRDFGRILTAMITPFHQDGTVNYKAAVDLAKYLVAHGSDGLVVAGSTGEAATMTKEEKLKLFESILEAVGDKTSVIAGTGSNDTRASVDMTKAAEKIGVHGVMLVGPYYNKPTQEGFFQHFKTIADETSLPIIVYNVPGRTASNILPATVLRLTQCKNIVALKEASGSLGQISEAIRILPKEFAVYSGDDGLALPILAVGGKGVISVAAHIVGEQMQQMISSFLQGQVVVAKDMHAKLLPFFDGIFMTTNPIPIKTAVNLIGLEGGYFRLPLVEATSEQKQELQKIMQDIGIL